MRVSKETRKAATLLMLWHTFIKWEAGELETELVTSYRIATWHSIAQSNAWKILNELVVKRNVKRVKLVRGDTEYIGYKLTKRGKSFVQKNVLACISAQNNVLDWKLQKYKKGLM